jgi:hypothetical protein
LCDTALNLCIGLIPLIDNFAHCGGFVVGLLRACAHAEPSPPSGAARCLKFGCAMPRLHTRQTRAAQRHVFATPRILREPTSAVGFPLFVRTPKQLKPSVHLKSQRFLQRCRRFKWSESTPPFSERLCHARFAPRAGRRALVATQGCRQQGGFLHAC